MSNSLKDGDGKGESRNIDLCEKHFDSDIALIRISVKEPEIKRPKGPPFKINSICLPFEDKSRETKLKMEIAGWGKHDNFNSPKGEPLQKATIEYMGGEGCSKRYRPKAFYCMNYTVQGTKDTCKVSET